MEFFSFRLSLEFWNSVHSNCMCKFSDFTSYRDLKLIESISGTFRLIGSVLKEIEFFLIFQVYVYRVLRNSRYTSLVRTRPWFVFDSIPIGPILDSIHVVRTSRMVRIYQIFDVPRLQNDSATRCFVRF